MTQYMILHKVRGEPALDIAEQADIAGEVGWIISTSGHRAYPIDFWPIHSQINKTLQYADQIEGWDELPDHYVAQQPRPERRRLQKALNKLHTLSKLSDTEIEDIVRAIAEEENK